MTSTYRCIQCNGALAPREDALTCAVCKSSYPIVGGVKVLTANPETFLKAQVRKLTERRQEVTEGKARLERVSDPRYSEKALSLALGGYESQLKNLDTIEQAMAPVKEYLSAQPQRRNFLGDFHLGDSGWASFNMLGYFYRDWCHTEESRFLKNLFFDAIDRHGGGERQSAAVLGCGACGLVYDLAELFPRVSGLDLGIDLLLLAQSLLDGNELELQISFPRPQIPLAQKTVKLQPPAQRREGIDLVAANVNKLPFPSASLSCVVTPYLLDVVPSPAAVVAEIRRVLAPQGIWINFSNPSGASLTRSIDQLNDLDVESYLGASGFKLLDYALHRFKLMDLTPLWEWATTPIETPVFFVAKKEGAEDGGPRDSFAEYFSGAGDSVWGSVPKISAYVGMIQEKAFTGNGIADRRRIAIYAPNNGRPISEQSAAIAELLLRSIDGTRTIREMFEGLRRQYGEAVSGDDFLRLFRDLQDAALIELHEQRPAS